MFRALTRWVARWKVSVGVGVIVLALVASLGYFSWRAGRQKAAVTAQRLAVAAVAEAHAHDLPAPPPATGTAEQQAVQAVKQHLLTPPPGPGTMADVEASEIGLAYLFSGQSGKTEWVDETMRVRNVTDHEITSLIVPLLSKAFNVHADGIGGPELESNRGTVVVPVTLAPNANYVLIHVAYQVPYDFLQPQTWKVPTFTLHGLWIVFWPQEPYLAVRGQEFHREPALDAESGGGLVWTTDAPIRSGFDATWAIVPANTVTYPSTQTSPPLPRSCVTPSGQPVCKESGG